MRTLIIFAILVGILAACGNDVDDLARENGVSAEVYSAWEQRCCPSGVCSCDLASNAAERNYCQIYPDDCTWLEVHHD